MFRSSPLNTLTILFMLQLFFCSIVLLVLNVWSYSTGHTQCNSCVNVLSCLTKKPWVTRLLILSYPLIRLAKHSIPFHSDQRYFPFLHQFNLDCLDLALLFCAWVTHHVSFKKKMTRKTIFVKLAVSFTYFKDCQHT